MGTNNKKKQSEIMLLNEISEDVFTTNILAFLEQMEIFTQIAPLSYDHYRLVMSSGMIWNKKRSFLISIDNAIEQMAKHPVCTQALLPNVRAVKFYGYISAQSQQQALCKEVLPSMYHSNSLLTTLVFNEVYGIMLDDLTFALEQLAPRLKVLHLKDIQVRVHCPQTVLISTMFSNSSRRMTNTDVTCVTQAFPKLNELCFSAFQVGTPNIGETYHIDPQSLWAAKLIRLSPNLKHLEYLESSLVENKRITSSVISAISDLEYLSSLKLKVMSPNFHEIQSGYAPSISDNQCVAITQLKSNIKHLSIISSYEEFPPKEFASLQYNTPKLLQYIVCSAMVEKLESLEFRIILPVGLAPPKIDDIANIEMDVLSHIKHLTIDSWSATSVICRKNLSLNSVSRINLYDQQMWNHCESLFHSNLTHLSIKTDATADKVLRTLALSACTGHLVSLNLTASPTVFTAGEAEGIEFKRLKELDITNMNCDQSSSLFTYISQTMPELATLHLSNVSFTLSHTHTLEKVFKVNKKLDLLTIKNSRDTEALEIISLVSQFSPNLEQIRLNGIESTPAHKVGTYPVVKGVKRLTLANSVLSLRARILFWILFPDISYVSTADVALSTSTIRELSNMCSYVMTADTYSERFMQALPKLFQNMVVETKECVSLHVAGADGLNLRRTLAGGWFGKEADPNTPDPFRQAYHLVLDCMYPCL